MHKGRIWSACHHAPASDPSGVSVNRCSMYPSPLSYITKHRHDSFRAFMRPRADRGRARRASSAAPSTLENGAPGGRFEAMASELWTLLVTGVATIAAVAAAHYVVKQNRARRLRVLAATNLFMQEAWNTVAAIPLPFLPLAVRVVLGKVMQVRLARALRYFPDNDRL